MRAVYGARWCNGGCTKPRNVPTCVQVAVGEATTGAEKTVLLTISKTPAHGAGFARVGGVDEHHGQAGGLGLVGDKLLQLRPGPAVQARAKVRAGLDPLANIRQVLHRDRAAFRLDRCGDDRLADLVVHMPNVPGFAAGGFDQSLPCRLGAVALKPFAKGQKRVALVPQPATTEQLAGAGRRQDVLAQIDAENVFVRATGRFGQVENQVEIVPSLAKHQFRFLGSSHRQIPALELPRAHGHDHPATGGEKGQGFALEAVGPFVEMDRAGGLERNHRQRFLFQPGIARKQRPVRLDNSRNGVAGHLRTQLGQLLPNRVVPQVMELDPVGASGFGGHGREQIARTGECFLQQGKPFCLLGGNIEFDTDRALHLPPSLDVFGSFDVPLNGFGTDLACGTDVVGGSPQAPAPKDVFHLRKPGKELPG